MMGQKWKMAIIKGLIIYSIRLFMLNRPVCVLFKILNKNTTQKF